jgi:histidinol-phosphate aminotransferase
VAGPLAEISDSFFRPAVNDLVPYEPGKPVEEVQRELGREQVVKLASNEGPFGPFPEAREAIARIVPELNRYPDGGAYRIRAALAERLDLPFEAVAPGAGSDGSSTVSARRSSSLATRSSAAGPRSRAT